MTQNTPSPQSSQQQQQPAPPTHPLQKFRFCPVCGSPHFTEHNFKSKHCADCGFTYYANPCSATATFIRNARGELLVAVRGKEPAKGTLDLPGGFVDMYETAEEGIIREVQEETSLVITQPRYLFSIPNRYLYSGMVIHTLDMFFEVTLVGNASQRSDALVGNASQRSEESPVTDNIVPHAADDVSALSWMPIERVDPSLFGLQSISQAVKQYLNR